jgi:hypothetical protein
MDCGLFLMVNTLNLILLTTKDDSNLFQVLKLILIVILLALLVFYILRSRIYRSGTPGRKRSFSEKLVQGKIQITLSGDRSSNPSYIMMVVRNIGKRDVDLDAPVLTFRRWRSKRMYRILTVRESEIYPMMIDPGQESVINISLEQFYHEVPELRRACRLEVEMKDDTGRRFKSRTIRLKWI